MSEYARELVREAIGYSRCGYLDVQKYDQLVDMVDGLLALESETNEKLESAEMARDFKRAQAGDE